jgi:AraC-like DNA-binding protein
MNSLIQHLMLTTKVRTGFSRKGLICTAVAALSAVIAFVFGLLAVFILLAQRFDALTAGLALACLFLAIAVIAGLTALLIRRRTIARAQRVSARTLQRAFASHESGVMRWLRDERLARCAAALADPALKARAIADIALANGFRDVPAFCRSFKARYGRTPGGWREAQSRHG